MNSATELVDFAQGPLIAIALLSKRALSYFNHVAEKRPYTVLLLVILFVLLFPMSAAVVIGGSVLLASWMLTAAVGTALFAPALFALALVAVALWGLVVASWSAAKMIRSYNSVSTASAGQTSPSPTTARTPIVSPQKIRIASSGSTGTPNNTRTEAESTTIQNSVPSTPVTQSGPM